MKYVMLLLVLFSGLLVAEDAPSVSVPAEQRYHLEAINANMTTIRVQVNVLQEHYSQLSVEHDGVIKEACTKAEIKPDECAVDETKTPYVFVKKEVRK